MKIKELHITRFGTIRGLDLELQDNMNYLFGLEEDTKTAVMDFIVVMFYGTVNNFREDIREKYLPLDGSDMSGSVLFEFRNEEYLLERIFNAGRYKKDSIILKNLTRDSSETLPYNVKPGEHLFNVSKDIFFRNTHINLSDTTSGAHSDYNAMMTSVLSNLISTGAETKSVSDVAGMLNSYCDPGLEESISYAMNEKREEMRKLNENLSEAQKIEKMKLEHQHKCDEIHARYNAEQKKYKKVKKTLEIQSMLSELDSINGLEDSEHSFITTSERYNALSAELKKSRILENRNQFDRAYEKYKNIRNLKKEQDSELQKKINLSVDLGRYTPKGDEASLQNVISLQTSIEKTEETIRTLHVQLNEKREERNQLKEKLRDAKDAVEEAEKALTRQDEMAKNKIAQAEETLHNSSYNVDTEPVKKSKNLVSAVIILIILIALLITFLNYIVLAVIFGAGILSVVYAILVKVSKEKQVKQYSRVDENQLRTNERNLRNLRNQCTAERDKYVSKVAVARNKYDELKRRDSELKKQLTFLENEIKSSEDNISKFSSDRENAEKNFSSPDPRFYTIRTEINEIERSTELRGKNIADLKKSVISDLAVFRDLSDFDQAEAFIDSNMNLLSEYDKLSEKLSVLGDKEKSAQIAASNKKRVQEIKEALRNASSKGIPVTPLSTEELNTLHNMSHSLLQESVKINNEYISAITKLKIEYNDSTCVANVEHTIHRLEREISEIDTHIKTVKLAIEGFNEALVDVHDGYAPKVAGRASEILSELSNGKYTRMTIKGGKILIRDKDKNPVSLDKMSRSSCDLAYFSLRLAVAEITAGPMNYPVILDDRFSGSKSVPILNFLKKYAEKSQILIFSNTNKLTSVAANEQISIDDVNIISVSV